MINKEQLARKISITHRLFIHPLEKGTIAKLFLVSKELTEFAV